MHLSAKQEQFSLAYLRAIAAVAGCSFTVPDVDEGIDVIFESSEIKGVLTAPKIQAQVKSYQEEQCENGILKYNLKVNNYNILVGPTTVPSILVVVSVPVDIKQWVHQDNNRLAMQRCAYWTSIRGLDESSNASSVCLDIDRQSIFSSRELNRLLQIMANGGLR